jgi:hypothetical protein
MSPARGPHRRLFVWVAFIGIAGTAGAVRADEPADRGISLSAWAGGALDRSVTAADSGHRVGAAAPIFGATGLGNIERVAIGAGVDATPSSLGNGRLSLGALLGYQRQIGRTRFRVLAEGGGHRFAPVGGPSPARPESDAWLPYAGLRLGATRTVPAHGFVELGLWLFGRCDLGHKTVPIVSSSVPAEEGRTDYRLGGLWTGVAVELGMRLESPHPWNQGVAEW